MAKGNLGQGTLAGSAQEAAGGPGPSPPSLSRPCSRRARVLPLLGRRGALPPRAWGSHSAPQNQVSGLMSGGARPEATLAWPPRAQEVRAWGKCLQWTEHGFSNLQGCGEQA